MNLPELTIRRIPGALAYPVAILLPNNTPICLMADLSPDYDPEAVAAEIVRATRLQANVRLYTIRPARINN